MSEIYTAVDPIVFLIPHVLPQLTALVRFVAGGVGQ